ncbi:hypothetical protein O2W15_16335 [Modestobacter sp. VKM Ac-2979]|uniref:hypothetical protein n=1 Tax=unclassified Modestobacter TaxID=2643866 RepID=UPI0022AB7FAD|nr:MULTISPECIES: hypothetical protein [unclassified Modestobacter]MCZ2813004.1 hypothetical protein [Modestobacter sp. VKM Ac-2979]MCZ2842967.1 hypothetical protein [Modestobacter sp. VKM Ac-2980]
MSTSTGGNGASSTGGIRVLRLVLVVLYVGIALPGALVTPVPRMLLLAPLVGAFAAVVAGLANPGFPAQPRARRVVLAAFAGAVLTVPFASGVGLLGPSGAWLVIGMVLMAATVVASWIAECDSAPLPLSDPRRVAALRDFVSVLPTEALIREWRATVAPLQVATDPQERAALVRVRGLVLDELVRRDPEAVARWLEDGGPADPGTDVRRQRGPAG